MYTKGNKKKNSFKYVYEEEKEDDWLIKMVNDRPINPPRNEMDRTAAHWAAADGCYEALMELKSLGADVEKKDKYGMTPLLWAAWYGHNLCVIQLTKIYKEKVIGRNKRRMNLLHCAAANDQYHIVEFVGECLEGFQMNAKDINGWSALHMACDKAFTLTVKMLLKFKVKVDTEDKSGCSPIHYACRNGNMNVIKQLIRAGASISCQDKSGLTPLHYAVTNDKIWVVRKLLKRLKHEEFNMKSLVGETAFVVAAMEGKKDILSLFLRHRFCDVNVQDNNGNTVCHLCCRRTTKSHHVLETILNSNKADVNILNDRGDLAIHAAIEYDECVIVNMLIRAGSSLFVKTKYGNSPLSLAMKSGDADSVDAIIRGQRLLQLSGNDKYFQVNFKPEPMQDLDLSDDSDVDIDDTINKEDNGEEKINSMNGDNSGRKDENMNLSDGEENKYNDNGDDNVSEKEISNNKDDEIDNKCISNEADKDSGGQMQNDVQETNGDSNKNKDRNKSVGNLSINTEKSHRNERMNDENEDNYTDTIGSNSDKDLYLESDDEDEKDKRLKEYLIQTTLQEEDKTSDIIEAFKRNHNDLLVERRMSILSKASGSSSVSFNSIVEMKEVRKQLIKNLSYLKDHEQISSKGMFDEVEGESDKVCGMFQKDLRAVLKEMEDEDLSKKEKDDMTRNLDDINKDETSIKKEADSLFGDSIDMQLFYPFGSHLSTSNETLVVVEEEENEALLRKVKIVLWKVAHKRMKKREWVELARHWDFTNPHIQAIQHFEDASSKTYKESSYRLLNIWLYCFREIEPNESPVKEVFEAFVAIGNKPLADRIRSKIHETHPKKGCIIS